MRSCDVCVVGCGPIGSYLAEMLGKAGFDVVAVDMKKRVGKHACSGLISTRLDDFFRIPKKIVEHKVKGAVFHAASRQVELKRRDVQAYVIDRVKLDSLLFRRMAKFCEPKLGTKFVDYRVKSNRVIADFIDENGKPVKISCKILVGADGATSRVRKTSGLKGKIKIIKAAIGYVDVEAKDECVDIYFDNKFAYGFFAWKIPRGSRLELGLGCEGMNAVNNLEQFAKEQGFILNKVYAHPIVYGIQDSASERVILVGDAAAQVKPFSGGGIIYGLLCSRIAFNAIKKAFETGDFSARFLSREYDAVWKAMLLEKIKIGMGVRRLIKKMNKHELDEFMDVVEEHKDMLLKFADMDFL